MAESMTGLKRSSRCALVSENDIGKELTLMGWVQRRRNLGALIFVDLRDISGLIQILLVHTDSLHFADEQFVCPRLNAIHDTALNADRAIRENRRVDSLCVFPSQPQCLKLVAVPTRAGAEIVVLLLEKFLRQIDNKTAAFFDHVMGEARRDNANHDHCRVKTDIRGKTHYQSIVKPRFVTARDNRLRNRLHTKRRVFCRLFHIHVPIRMPDLARHVDLNQSYLSTLFKRETGFSVSDYIMERRIETAKNMLRYSDYSPAQIGEILSFCSQSHFIRCFRKLTGSTPSQYQRTHYHAHLDAASGTKPDAKENT